MQTNFLNLIFHLRFFNFVTIIKSFFLSSISKKTKSHVFIDVFRRTYRTTSNVKFKYDFFIENL